MKWFPFIALSIASAPCICSAQDWPINPEPSAVLIVKSKSIAYHDTNGNGRLEAGEVATVEWLFTNVGKGISKNHRIVSLLEGTSADISVIVMPLSDIKPNQSVPITAIIKAGMNLQSGRVSIRLFAKGADGTESDPVEVIFETLAFQPPKIVVAEGVFHSEGHATLSVNTPVDLEVLLQNTGTGSAQDIVYSIKLPDKVSSLDPSRRPIARLRPGEGVRVHTSFLIAPDCGLTEVPIKVTLREKHFKYGSSYTFTVRVDQPLTRIVVEDQPAFAGVVIPATLPSDVDHDIPGTQLVHENRFALVVGNEDYQRFQPGLTHEQNVAFARNDAYVFREYLINTLGYPTHQVVLLTDATQAQLRNEVERLAKMAGQIKGAEIVFYYAGHGLSDRVTQEGFILPVDVTAAHVRDGLMLSDLYGKLGSSGAHHLTVFLDACFNGGGRGESGLLSPRATGIKQKKDELTGNIVVFSAVSADQSALPRLSQSHGLFTYFMLRKLKETKGEVALKELADYLSAEIQKTSQLENKVTQTPTFLMSPDATADWIRWKL